MSNVIGGKKRYKERNINNYFKDSTISPNSWNQGEKVLYNKCTQVEYEF